MAVAGAAVRGAVARRIATTARPATASATLASAWCSCPSSKKKVWMDKTVNRSLFMFIQRNEYLNKTDVG